MLHQSERGSHQLDQSWRSTVGHTELITVSGDRSCCKNKRDTESRWISGNDVGHATQIKRSRSRCTSQKERQNSNWTSQKETEIKLDQSER